MKISYKGVSFYLKQTTTTCENNINVYDIPNGTIITENTGAKAESIPVIGFAVGKHREMVRDQLLNACKDPKPGLLNHPYLGLLKVYAQKISVSTRYDEQNIVNFSLEFVEASTEKTKFELVDNLLSFLKKAKSLREKYTGVFLQGVAFIDLPEMVIKQALRDVLRSTSVIKGLLERDPLASLEQTLTQASHNFLNILGSSTKEMPTDDQLFLVKSQVIKGDKEEKLKLSQLTYNVFASIIIDNIANKIASKEILSRKQKNLVIDICKKLRLQDAENYYDISSFIYLFERVPFKTINIVKSTGDNALILIHKGLGDVEQCSYFLEKNELQSPFFIQEDVEVEVA